MNQVMKQFKKVKVKDLLSQEESAFVKFRLEKPNYFQEKAKILDKKRKIF